MRRILVGVAGFVVLASGLAMLVLPGPAFLVIPLGLGILALEFAWARTVRDRALARLRRQKRAWEARGKKTGGPGRRGRRRAPACPGAVEYYKKKEVSQ